MSWLSKLRSRFQRRSDPVPLPAEHNAHGITQVTDRSTVHIAWEDITRIIAYKKDCFTVDQIRLEISSREQTIVCTEDDQDLSELTSAIAVYLPNIKPDWYSVVASAPAFEPAFTRVYPADR